MSDARRSRSRRDLTRGRVRADTIVATATAAGRAALAVVRLSGPKAEDIGRAVLSKWPETPRTFVRCRVHEPGPNGAMIDEGMVVVFPAPHSYTGETVVEIHCHGGTFVPSAIEAALVRAGARPALAGEFTERAVLNGKLDLVRAEAIGELIDARTKALHRSALHALSGNRTREYSALRANSIALEALLAYDVDFPEEDDGPVSRERVEAAALELRETLDRLCAGASRATIARDGALVVLAGAPNAGKSSLLNALVGESRVIVSDEPGTTRDAIEVLMDSDPWPMRLVDTAGIRDAAGVVERLGIEVSERYLKSADVVVLCSDTGGDHGALRERIAQLTDGSVLEVRTKADLRNNAPAGTEDCAVSATTGEGIEVLRGLLAERIQYRVGTADGSDVVASARQRAALEGAGAEVELFLDAWKERKLPAPVVASHLRAATAMLDELIGAIDVDDILERVFSTFCVGK